jgi:hypothetical protein
MVVAFVGLLLLLKASVFLIRFNLESSYLQVLFILYLFWVATVILRGWTFDIPTVYNLIFAADGSIWIYLAPIVLLLPKSLIHFRKVFRVIIILAIIDVVFTVVYIKQLTVPGMDLLGQALLDLFSNYLVQGCGFLLITYPYHKPRTIYFSFFVLILVTLLAILRARRTLILMCLNPIIFVAFFHLISTRKRALTVLAFSLVLIFGIVAGISIYQKGGPGIFSYLVERGSEDTRTGVEICMYEDMSSTDWIIGKGLHGEYYCPNIEHDGDNFRSGIETDYLHIILKGGLIQFALLMLILIPAVFKGWFDSKNLLSKAAALWILFYLLELYPAQVTKFSVNYLLVWMSVGICYSKSLRHLPETVVRQYFKSKPEIVNQSGDSQ